MTGVPGAMIATVRGMSVSAGATAGMSSTPGPDHHAMRMPVHAARASARCASSSVSRMGSGIASPRQMASSAAAD